MSEYTYSAHALPTPVTAPSTSQQELDALQERYAALRLEALLTAPHAFGSTHALESAFTPEEWRGKIWREDAVVLVCVARPPGAPAFDSDNQKEALLDSQSTWVGSAIMRGPLPGSEYELQTSEGAPPLFGSDAEETKWHMTAVFASAAHRGCGIGKMLIQKGKEYSLGRTAGLRGPSKARFRVMIHPDNFVVVALYSKSGFVDAGRTTGQEAYRANGDLDGWDKKYHSLSDEMKVYWTTANVAIVMEWVGQI
ncbi:hypothetical protein FB45DRAFT_898482 [Roridomyces roridus]|uniref:N-acetyltransferase domain-containing protein n=1 Tax=Roridomyces roridus TaxID=1738132 RepID=A0AAD7CC11_9AGAR|nr:hypothetical protein FB45DRAFT_898482 [Roridomyces roridus]